MSDEITPEVRQLAAMYVLLDADRDEAGNLTDPEGMGQALEEVLHENGKST